MKCNCERNAILERSVAKQRAGDIGTLFYERANLAFRVWHRTSRTGLSYLTSSRFPTDRSKAVSLLQFLLICASVVSHVAFVLSILFLISPSFGALDGLCSMIEAFPGYLHLYIFIPDTAPTAYICSVREAVL